MTGELSRRSTLMVGGGALVAAALVGSVVLIVSRPEELATLRGHGGPVRSVAIDAHGSLLASASDDGTVRIWDLATNATLHTLELGGKVHAVAFGPDSLLAATTDDATVQVWDARAGQKAYALSGAKKTLECVAFSPDGTTLAAAGIEGPVYLWKLKDRGAPTALPGHLNPARSDATARSSSPNCGDQRCPSGIWRSPSS